jgi:superfamily II DNA or RNA helicase
MTDTINNGLGSIIDQLKPGIIVRSPFFSEPVRVIITLPVGDAIKLIGTGVDSNRTYEPVLSAEQLLALQIAPERPPYDGNGLHFKLGVEALRLELAYEYDPFFALSIARIDPLPHQLEAVYDYFMKAPRIRFLLADDPGAGKTIMGGLTIQELKARGLIQRILILTPANLTFQWQRELKDKFRQQFDVLNGAVLRSTYGTNPWQERNQVISSLSWVSRIDDARDSLLRSHWDLIIVDEAHKMSASSPKNKTLAYQLGEALSERTDHYLLMTATPHKGDPQAFSLFLRLLDQDVYGDIASLEEAMRRHAAPFYLRRVKEALVSFPDPETGMVKSLFTKRHVHTSEFKIDDEEWDFYDALTRFVKEQSVAAAQDTTARGRAVGFTMAMLQRRFASSVYAARRTLERMKQRREKILADPRTYINAQIAQRLPDDFDELTEEEQQELLDELESAVISVDPAVLQDEIQQLGYLIVQAKQLEAREVETKLNKLRETISSRGIFDAPKMKLLIFTEHKDTLDYLAGDGKDGRPLGKLREWGLTVTQIHGGMKIGDRDTPGSRIYAEREFREDCQVLVATEAAGEGINLQFCWFMINYDIPWNPVRLEQRMGRIHRYGQERDCLIVNFVATNTAEGRVLQKLFERVEAIENDLDPGRTGKVFNVLGDVFPANQLERWVREMYANSLGESAIKERIVEQVDIDRFRQITESTLEGLARRELNLSAIIGRTAEAKERRLVPEVIENFFVQTAPLVGLTPRNSKPQPHVYRLGRLPRPLLTQGERLEPRFGKLGREYKQIAFAQQDVKADPTLEWVTPGHPLFEAVRAELNNLVRGDLERGAIFFDLNREAPGTLDLFTAAIVDGRGNVLHRRLFVVETRHDGAITIRQPALFLDLIPAPATTPIPAEDGAMVSATRSAAEKALIEAELNNLLRTVGTERIKEIDTVSRHLEISLGTLIDRYNLRLNDLIAKQMAGNSDPLLAANMKQEEDRLDELEARRTRRRQELQQERNCTIADIRHCGRAWALPHPDRHTPSLAPMVRDENIERIAVAAVTAYEEARGWQVESVETENKGFDLISRRFAPNNPEYAVEVRYIEVKGRALEGIVALSANEYQTAYRLKGDYWLYVVFNCAPNAGRGPDVYPIQDPARLRWEPMREVVQYRVDAQTIIEEAQRAPGQLSQVQHAFQEAWGGRIDQYGRYNILVEGESDKAYLDLAIERYHAATGVDLLDGGEVRIVAGRGTKRAAPDFGLLQSLEDRGIRFVFMLDGDEPGEVAAEAMRRFNAQKNRHYFHLERDDYKDKAGKSWAVEIEDMLPWSLLEAFITQHPAAVEERFQRTGVHKVVILGKPVERDGQIYDYKIMLTDFVRQRATPDDLMQFVNLIRKARKCMGLKG